MPATRASGQSALPIQARPTNSLAGPTLGSGSYKSVMAQPNPSHIAQSQPAPKVTGIERPQKVIGSFAKGGKVKKTGAYKLEKGEKVLSKDKVMAEEHKKKSRTASALSSGKAKSSKSKSHGGKSKHPSEIHIKKTANGKFLAKHVFDKGGGDGMPQPDETHALNDIDELKDHIGEHMGGEEGGLAQPQGGLAQPAQPSPMMGQQQGQ